MPRSFLIELLLELRRAYQQLQNDFDTFRRQMLGRSSEKLHLAELPQLPFEDLPARVEVETEIEEVTIKRKKRKPTGRGKLPEGLARHRRILRLRPEDRICTGCEQEMESIGEETSEQLDYRASSLRIVETVRHKFACRRCQDQVITTPLPKAAVPKCLATPSLLAHVVSSKYADHLPLNRQEGILARHGVHVSRKTMSDWVGYVSDAFTPLYDVAKAMLLRSRIIRADDTSIRYLLRPLKQTRKGHLWDFLAGDGRLVVFDFTTDWCAEGPTKFLKGFTGKLQADAYKGWDVVARLCPGIELVGCMAHARRKFHDAKSSDILMATIGLLRIQEIYRIEATVKELSAPERAKVRRERAGPVLEKLRDWIASKRATVLPKSPMGIAFTYMTNQWDELSRYLDDGELAIDNNDTERVLRSVAVGRANWLFAGNEGGGRRAAVLYTMVMSCKLNRIDPYAWLVDVLTRLPETDSQDLANLLPQQWTPVTDIAKDRVATVTESELLVPLIA